MPTYDYECDACGHEFELFQAISEEPKRKCPACKKAKLRRLFGTGAAVMFKGSGFHQTDYRSESYKKAAAADSSTKSDSTPKSDSSPSTSKSGDSKTSDSSAKSESGGGKKPPQGDS